MQSALPRWPCGRDCVGRGGSNIDTTYSLLSGSTVSGGKTHLDAIYIFFSLPSRNVPGTSCDLTKVLHDAQNKVRRKFESISPDITEEDRNNLTSEAFVGMVQVGLLISIDSEVNISRFSTTTHRIDSSLLGFSTNDSSVYLSVCYLFRHHLQILCLKQPGLSRLSRTTSSAKSSPSTSSPRQPLSPQILPY